MSISPRLLCAGLAFCFLLIFLAPDPTRHSHSLASRVGLDVPPLHSLIPPSWVPDWPSFDGTLVPPANDLSLPQVLPPLHAELSRPYRWGDVDPEYEPATGPTGLAYHPNGHMLVAHPSPPGNTSTPAGARGARLPLEPHPIVTLMDRAEVEWRAKVDRQSRTLRGCVQEYKRRYQTSPPRGFEKWWQYAKANKVVLTDEYDQIFRDLYPFWAINPEELRRRSDYVRREREYTYTLVVHKNGSVSTTGEYAALKRARDLADLIEMVRDYSAGAWEEVIMSMTRDDQPEIQLGWRQRDLLFDLAARGEYLDSDKHVIQEDAALTNWAAACPPESPLRRLTKPKPDVAPLDTSATSAPRSFIWSHRRAMDPCLHPPEIMNLHGFTSGEGTTLGLLLPLFSFSKTDLHSDILVTPLEQYSEQYSGDDMPWAEKPIEKVVWRGTTTGAWQGVDNPHWNISQRIRLHLMTHKQDGTRSLLISSPSATSPAREVEVPNHFLNSQFMDTSLVDKPIQCDEPTCKVLDNMIQFADRVEWQETLKYKYVVDVDGNAWSGRFHRLMWTNRMVIKSTIFPEWYADRVQPWLHYAPTKLTYDDLYGIVAFFMGGVEGSPSNDRLAEKIASAGRDWARAHWRKEDMAAYMFRLVLEWSRIYHRGPRGETADFDEALLPALEQAYGEA